jgi:hypothetical protein
MIHSSKILIVLLHQPNGKQTVNEHWTNGECIVKVTNNFENITGALHANVV